VTEPAKLRVLHLNAGNMLGGVESVLLTFAEFSKTCPAFEQEFTLAFDGRFAHLLRAAGATVHILPETQLRNPLSVRRSRLALRELLAKEHFDCVISHSTWCQVVFAPAVKKAKLPLVFWMHNDFDGHWLQKLASRHAPDLAICNSEFTRSTLKDVYPKTPGVVIYNPVKPAVVPSGARESLRRELNVAPETVVILMASRMEAWKGHLNLIRAAARIESRQNWVIWIAGGPQTEKERGYVTLLHAEVSRRQLAGKIRLLGHRDDVPALMRAVDIYCQPNAQPEPFGVVFVEALQAGVPIVTFEMGGTREILTESSGILVPPGDIAALATALVPVIENRLLRATLGAQGPARARELCDPAQQIRRAYDVLRAHCNR